MPSSALVMFLAGVVEVTVLRVGVRSHLSSDSAGKRGLVTILLLRGRRSPRSRGAAAAGAGRRRGGAFPRPGTVRQLCGLSSDGDLADACSGRTSHHSARTLSPRTRRVRVADGIHVNLRWSRPVSLLAVIGVCADAQGAGGTGRSVIVSPSSPGHGSRDCAAAACGAPAPRVATVRAATGRAARGVPRAPAADGFNAMFCPCSAFEVLRETPRDADELVLVMSFSPCTARLPRPSGMITDDVEELGLRRFALSTGSI